MNWLLRLSVLTALIALCFSGCSNTKLKPQMMSSNYDVTKGRSLQNQEDRMILVTMRNLDHDQLVQGGAVNADQSLPPRYASFVASMAKQHALRRVADWPLDSLDIRCFVFAAPDASSRDRLITSLTSNPLVESAQAMQVFRTMADLQSSVHTATTTANMEISDQAPYNDPYLNMQHGFRFMQIPDSHRFATGKGVRVAIIDTGIDTNHPDIKDRIVGSKNFIDRNSGAFRNDIHGTAIAGVIGAAANNAQGIVGVAPEAEIIALKACKQIQKGDSKATCHSFALAKALDFAILQDVSVINLSLAGPKDPILARLVRKAIERDILVVGAADPKRPAEFPAYIKGVVAVSESKLLDDNTTLIRAPGHKIISSYPDNRYEFFTGSSLATAQVSGIGALIRERKPHLPGDVVQSLITTTAEANTGTANGCRALARIVSGAVCPAK